MFSVTISAAEHLYVRWKVLYMRCLCFEFHTVALTQSMSVHYSQRKHTYFTAKNAQTVVLVYCYTALYLINHIWRYLYVLVEPFFDVSSLSHCNLYCWICAYPAIDYGYIDVQLGILRLWAMAMISLSHGLRHVHTHFWQVHSFEFQYKCITEKCILPFYKRPGQKHNFICCLKCAGQLPFINICETRQSCEKFS